MVLNRHASAWVNDGEGASVARGVLSIAGHDTDSTLLVALQVLPAISIFITGFVSVRLYGQRDRALKRADTLEAEIRDVMEADAEGADRDLEDLGRTHVASLAQRPSAKDAAVVNGVVLFLILVLELVEVRQAGWKWPWLFSQVASQGLAMTAILLVQVMIVMVSLLDYWRVTADLDAKAQATVWGKAATAAFLVAEHKEPKRAFELANAVLKEFPGVPWALRLRACARLLEEGVQAGDDALLDALRATAAQQQRGRPYIEELKLRSRVRQRIGESEQAIQDLSEAIQMSNKHDSDLWVGRGDLYKAMGKPDKARADYEQAILLESANIAPVLAMAGMELDEDRLDSAVSLAQQACELEPDSLQAQDLKKRAEEARRRRDAHQARSEVKRRFGEGRHNEQGP